MVCYIIVDGVAAKIDSFYIGEKEGTIGAAALSGTPHTRIFAGARGRL